MGRATTAYELAARARERHASELFNLETVRQAIENRAADGYRDLRLVQKHPFDLSRSTPASRLEDWLEKHHYRYVWSPTSPFLDPLRSPVSEEYPELVVFW